MRLKQVAAVCSTPASKAEFLGYTLVQQIFRCLEAQEQQVGQYQEMLLDVFNGNHDVLSGVFAAVESKKSPLFASSSAKAQLALTIISPLCVRVLIGAEGAQFALN